MMIAPFIYKLLLLYADFHTQCSYNVSVGFATVPCFDTSFFTVLHSPVNLFALYYYSLHVQTCFHALVLPPSPPPPDHRRGAIRVTTVAAHTEAQS